MLDFITPFVGLIAAIVAVATLPKGKRDPGGVIIPLIIGIGGAILGRYLFASFAYGPVQNLSREPGQPGFLLGILGSVVGAAVPLIIYRVATRGVTAD